MLLRRSGLLALIPLFVSFGTPFAWDINSSGLSKSPIVTYGVRSFVWVFLDGSVAHESLRAGIEETGAVIRTESRWLHALSVSADPASLEEVKRLPGVVSIRTVGSAVSYGGRAAEPGVHGAIPQVAADPSYGDLGQVMERLGIPALHELGFSGAGIRVGILGGHFTVGHQALRGLNVVGTRDFVDQDGSVEPGVGDPADAAAHGTALFSLVGGRAPDLMIAPAFGAGFILARVVHGSEELPRTDEDLWVAGLEWLESQGARVVLSGVSFRSFQGFEYPFEAMDGDQAPATRAADEAARRGVLVAAPMGNSGPEAGSLGAPADGDSVLAVGAADETEQITPFSSRGPTYDGRPRPSILAPGVELSAASTADTEGVSPVTGTEFAAALIAGSAALFAEAHPGRTTMEILDALASAASSAGPGSLGIPDVAAAVLFPDGLSLLPLEEADSDGTVTNLTPFFQWDAPSVHPLALPVTFVVELSEDSTFRQIALADTVVGIFARRIPHPLPESERLFWRVSATTVQGVVRHTWLGDRLKVPPWVELQTLNDPGGAETSDPQPVLEWEAMPISPPAGPFTFQVQVISERDEEPLFTFDEIEEERLRVPEPLPFNVPLRWRVVAMAREGSADTVTSAGPFVVTSGSRPPVTILYQNFPNPFPRADLGVEETRIWFDLANASPVDLAVYDIRGRLVRRLIPRSGCGSVVLEPGPYGRDEGSPDPCVLLSWDGRDDRGRTVAPGVYLLRLRADGVEEIRRVVFWP